MERTEVEVPVMEYMGLNVTIKQGEGFCEVHVDGQYLADLYQHTVNGVSRYYCEDSTGESGSTFQSVKKAIRMFISNTYNFEKRESSGE